MSSDPKLNAEFRRACSRWATGVVVVTTFADEGSPQGFTANSFSSVSLNPPLISVCLDHRANVFPHFRKARTFAVNVLSENQQELSARFAFWDRDERYEGLEWKVGDIGAPLLAGAIAWLQCTVWKRIEAGDHTIFLGLVRRAESVDAAPLLYFSSQYRRLV